MFAVNCDSQSLITEKTVNLLLETIVAVQSLIDVSSVVLSLRKHPKLQKN